MRVRNIGLGRPSSVQARFAKAGVRRGIVVLEVQTMVDQRRPCKSVIADTIPVDPGIQKRQREQEQQ